MSEKREETSEERRGRIERYTMWAQVVILQVIFASIAWGAGLSSGEWILGMGGVLFACFVEHRFDCLSKQFERLEDRIRDTQESLDLLRVLLTAA